MKVGDGVFVVVLLGVGVTVRDGVMDGRRILRVGVKVFDSVVDVFLIGGVTVTAVVDA